MNRRDFLSTGGAPLSMAGTARVAGGISDRAPCGRRPDILIFITDQMRADHLDIADNSAIRKAHPHGLAPKRAPFRCADSPIPSCTPARACLPIRLSRSRHSLPGYGRIGARQPSDMPRLLQESGHSTTVIGKCHFYPHRSMQGFACDMLDESGRMEAPNFRNDLRDVLPTLPGATQLSAPINLDGASLLASRRSDATRRGYIDQEHDVCYAPSSHWKAPSDGCAKYIFHVQHATEPLFELRNDPHELRGLARASGSGNLLSMWRANGGAPARVRQCLRAEQSPGGTAVRLFVFDEPSRTSRRTIPPRLASQSTAIHRRQRGARADRQR